MEFKRFLQQQLLRNQSWCHVSLTKHTETQKCWIEALQSKKMTLTASTNVAEQTRTILQKFRQESEWNDLQASCTQDAQQRSTRAGFYTSDPDYQFQELCNEANHRLFNMILHSQYHVLQQLLPPALPQSYDFRKRPHTRHIPNRCSYLIDCNFLTRMLFADSYWWCFL